MAPSRKLLILAALLMLGTTTALADAGDCRLIRGADTPDDPSDDVSVCRADVWIHQADSKVGNAGGVGTIPLITRPVYPSWDTTPPSESVQSGAGGGYLGLAAFSQNVSRADSRAATTFRGTFTGNLDNIAATLYLFSPARQLDPTQAVWLRLRIDGETVYQTGSAADRTPLASGGNAVLKTDFAFVNIYQAMENLGLETGEDSTHSIELLISQWFTGNDNAVYVYDTTEVPSGMVFNLEPAPLASLTQIDVTGQ